MKHKILTFLRILFLIIYIIKPVRYCDNHNCYPIPPSATFREEISSIERNINSTILAKNQGILPTADAFSVNPNRGLMTATGMEGSNSPGGGGSSPSGGPADSQQFCPKDPTPKFVPQVQPPKTEKQKKKVH